MRLDWADGELLFFDSGSGRALCRTVLQLGRDGVDFAGRQWLLFFCCGGGLPLSLTSLVLQHVQTISEAVNEQCWRLPILPEHTEALKSQQADTRSASKGRYGGASTAAAFLQKFVNKDISWTHLDIAGPSNYSHAKSYFPCGATGFGVQLLFEYVKQQSRK